MADCWSAKAASPPAAISPSSRGASRCRGARSARRISAARLHRYARSFSAGARDRQPGRSLLDWLEQSALPEEVPHGRCALCRGDGRASSCALWHPRHHHRAGLRLAFRAGHRVPVRSGGKPPACASPADWSSPTACCVPTCTSRRKRPTARARDMIRRFHGKGRLLYAVTPRFALSTSEAMLEVCQTLLREHAGTAVPDASQ